jgi:hypothetical protein
MTRHMWAQQETDKPIDHGNSYTAVAYSANRERRGRQLNLSSDLDAAEQLDGIWAR